MSLSLRTYFFSLLLISPLTVCSASFDTTARLWDADTGACLKVFTHHNKPIYAISFSPDGRWLATGGGDGWFHLYDAAVRTGFAHPTSVNFTEMY
jgi:WD40 repeat protein